MKLRSNQVALGVFLVLCGIVIGLYIVYEHPAVPVDATDPDAFLEGVRQSIEAGSEGADGVGQIPGLGDDPSMVARIELEPSGEYYMGTIANDAMGYGEIKVHNRGKLPLDIKEIKTTCACTQGQMLTNPVPPGETGILKVGVNPWRVPDFESTKTLTLDTNDPQNAQISIKVRADIDPEFEVVPRNPDFGTIQKGARSTVTVVMRQLGEQQVTLQRVRVGGRRPWVEVAFEERPAELWANPNHVEYEIRITLTEDAPLGPVRVPYIIDSTCPRVRQLRCAAEGEVVSFYRLSRNQLYLGTYEVGSQIPEALVVSSDKPITISDATVSLEGLGVAVKPGQEPNSQVFEFSVDSVGRGKHVGDLRFSVSNGSEEAAERLPFELVVRGSGEDGASGLEPHDKHGDEAGLDGMDDLDVDEMEQ